LACSTTPYGEFEYGLNFAPRLAHLAGQVAILYIITNLNQGPVFTAVPGDPTYSGVWQITYVTYKPGKAKHNVKNAGDYRIPQGKVDQATYVRTKIICLPFWYAYCKDPVTKRVCVLRPIRRLRLL